MPTSAKPRTSRKKANGTPAAPANDQAQTNTPPADPIVTLLSDAIESATAMLGGMPVIMAARRPDGGITMVCTQGAPFATAINMAETVALTWRSQFVEQSETLITQLMQNMGSGGVDQEQVAAALAALAEGKGDASA